MGYEDAAGNDWGIYSAGQWNTVSTRFYFGHNDSGNYIFVDGHSTSKKLPEMQSYYSATAVDKLPWRFPGCL